MIASVHHPAESARPFAILIFALFGFIAGCGGGETARPQATLEGTVTIGGTPVETGRIHFLPTGAGQSQPATAEIVQGKFRCEQAPQGNVRVTFTATKQTGETSDRGYAHSESIVPGAYAQGIEIQVTGDNLSQDFHLEAK